MMHSKYSHVELPLLITYFCVYTRIPAWRAMQRSNIIGYKNAWHTHYTQGDLFMRTMCVTDVLLLPNALLFFNRSGSGGNES